METYFRHQTSQPAYWELQTKVLARAENIALYRRLSGNYSIPQNRGYWTLCHRQPPDSPGSEINQVCDAGLITKDQFFGVDRDDDPDYPEMIAQNAIWHPEANWYKGEWVDVIQELDNFNPALVYLDTTSLSGYSLAAQLLASTMYLCQVNTLILANVMLNNPRSKERYSPSQLVRFLERIVAPIELSKWRPEVENFTYNGSGKTNMITYALYKKEA